MPEAADAARLLRRVRAWAASGDGDPVASPLRPRSLARAAGWRGEPAMLVAALVTARIVEASSSGVRLRTPAGRTGAGSHLHSGGPAAQPTARQHTSMPAPALWEAALLELAALVNRANYDAFLAGTEGLYRSGQWFTVGVPSSYALTALADRFRPSLAWAVYVVSGERLGVRLTHAPRSGPLLHLSPGSDHHAPGDDPVPPSPLPPH